MNDFDQLMDDIEKEAEAEGPEAVAQLSAFKQRFAVGLPRLGGTIIGTEPAPGTTGTPNSTPSNPQPATPPGGRTQKGATRRPPQCTTSFYASTSASSKPP